MKKPSKYLITVLSILSLTIALNIIAFSKSFCTWYANNIYPVLNLVLGSITTNIPFALGEMLMFIGAFMLIVLILLLILLLFFAKKSAYKKTVNIYSKICIMVTIIMLFSYTVNWFIPIRGNVLAVSDNQRITYSVEELESLRNMLIRELNASALSCPRDAEGHLVYDYTQQDIFELMSSNSYRYPRLRGHYSELKPAMCSDILEFMSIGGYNYIYTMEPTYNKYCDDLFMPLLLCHELCHHKGYYLENEAEFLSTIILAESDNPIFKYSAYLQMVAYVDGAYYDALENVYSDIYSGDELISAMKEHLKDQEHIIALVYADRDYIKEKRQENFDNNVSEFAKNNLKEASEEIATKGWQIQGDLLKENSYSGVTLMLLQYYLEE